MKAYMQHMRKSYSALVPRTSKFTYTISHEYDLEYGTDILEIQADAVRKGSRVALLDDLLATGGTMNGAAKLFEKVDADVVGSACIIELTFLRGREMLSHPFSSLVTYDQ